MGEFHLETERLILREWRDADWEPLFRHTNTPAVMRWLGGVLDADAIAAQRQRLIDYAREHGHTLWAIERQAYGGHLAGELLGFCGLKRCNQQGGPLGDFEIGWRLREDAWGHGYAFEAASAGLRAGFEQFAAPHIIALTVMGNVPSWTLMERLGMRRREDLDFASHEWSDDGRIVAWSIDRPNWEARQ